MRLLVGFFIGVICSVYFFDADVPNIKTSNENWKRTYYYMQEGGHLYTLQIIKNKDIYTTKEWRLSDFVKPIFVNTYQTEKEAQDNIAYVNLALEKKGRELVSVETTDM